MWNPGWFQGSLKRQVLALSQTMQVLSCGWMLLRSASGAERVVVTTRGPGQFIGEVSLFEEHAGDAQWKTSVRARGALKALLLTRAHLRTLLQQRPEAEAAVRAGDAPLHIRYLPLVSNSCCMSRRMPARCLAHRRELCMSAVHVCKRGGEESSKRRAAHVHCQQMRTDFTLRRSEPGVGWSICWGVDCWKRASAALAV